MPDHRRRPRIPFEVDVCLRFPRRVVEARSGDVTMEGLFVRCDDPPPVGAECNVEVRLESGHDALPIRGRGTVVRHGGAAAPGIGLTFHDMEEGSLAHLWRVSRYNAAAEETEDR